MLNTIINEVDHFLLSVRHGYSLNFQSSLEIYGGPVIRPHLRFN